MAINIEELSDDEKRQLLADLQKSLKKPKKAAAAKAPAIKSKGSGCLGPSIAQRLALQRR